MSGVEDSIVEMKFDNALFEQKINETIKSLDKLRASLDFSSSKKAMNDLSTAGKNFNMGNMGQSIEDISRKFLAMSTVAITALANITTHALRTAASMANAFTFGPIQAGFQEMETNMNSIQTILANTESKGTTLPEVEGALQRLNEYSDKTIYNFGQMAKNIGTFTAAGVDLDTSVDSIKGIANLAAVSGSSAEQASGAMYQLSQAIATGSLKLIDWNSVVNAGMGGEVFKKAIFETGKAMGTLTDVPVDQTFKEWEEANGSFRDSLSEGWVTSDVLTTTLSTFTGDLSDAELAAKGFTEEQIANIKKMAATATGAATEVKTFTQLMGTVKEAIATGWADSFKLIIGNFGEAKELFTGINDAIGGFVGGMADSRNRLLAEWKFMGGRTKLIEGLKDGFQAIGNVIRSISGAFRDIFPKNTSRDLVRMTRMFAIFTKNLEALTKEHMPKIRIVFKTFFAAVEIGWHIIKGLKDVFVALFKAIAGGAGGPAFELFKRLYSIVMNLNQALVGEGGLRKFFDGIVRAIQQPEKALETLSKTWSDFVAIFTGGKENAAIGDAGKRFDRLKGIFEGIGGAFDWLVEKTEGVRQALGDLWNYVTKFFREIGDSMKHEMEQADFEGALDIFNVALLGGIAVMIRNFFKNFKFDFGTGIMEKIDGIFQNLTGTLKAMQTELKSRALMQIAIAMGVLTLSLVALSMIDSAGLTKALTAMAVGFAQLIAAMVAIDQFMSTFGAAKFAITAVGLGLLAGAMLILAAAMKVFSTMSWEEIAKGLVATAGGLTALVTAIQFMAGNTTGLVKAGISIIAIAIGLRILANAMQAMATMGWEEIAKGLAGVGGGLFALVTAMNKISAEDMIQAGVGIIAIAIGMRILANAMQAMATMSWEEIAKGLITTGLALGIIVLLTNTIPAGGLVGIGAGLILVAIALNIVAQAIQTMGGMKLGELAKGLGAMAIALLLMAVAANAMTGALPGAAAMLVVAGALLVVTKVIKTLGEMDIQELIIGMVALAAIFAVIGGAAALLSGVIPAMLGLGVALGLIGIGLAAFGIGAFFVAKALEVLSKVGVKAMNVIIEMIAIFVARAPLIGIAIASVIVAAATDLAEAAPALIKAVKVVLLELLEAIIELVPKLVEALGVILDGFLEFIIDKSPDIIAAGIELILNFMDGIRDNIGDFIKIGSDIIVNFLNGIAKNDQDIIEAAINLVESFLEALAGAAADIATAGLMFLTNFLSGIVDNIQLIIDAGVQMVKEFLFGVTKGALEIAATVTILVTTFINEMTKNALIIVKAGTDAIVAFLGGITESTDLIAEAVTTVITNLIEELGEAGLAIVGAGTDALSAFLDGLKVGIIILSRKITETGLAIANAIAGAIVMTTGGIIKIIVKFCNDMADVIESGAPRVHHSFKRLGLAIIDGIVTILVGPAAKEKLKNAAITTAETFLGPLAGPLGWALGSPSKKTMVMGRMVLAGLVLGLRDRTQQAAIRKTAIASAKDATDAIEQAFSNLASLTPVIEDINPVVTPIVDLTQIEKGAKQIDGMMSTATVGAQVSFERAKTIAVAESRQNGSEIESPNVPTQQTLIFNQTNNSPKALSTSDIYRNTKSQIVLVKEELKLA